MLPEKLGYGSTCVSSAVNVTTGTLAEASSVVSCGIVAVTVMVWQVAPASSKSVLMPVMDAQAASLDQAKQRAASTPSYEG